EVTIPHTPRFEVIRTLLQWNRPWFVPAAPCKLSQADYEGVLRGAHLDLLANLRATGKPVRPKSGTKQRDDIGRWRGIDPELSFQRASLHVWRVEQKLPTRLQQIE